MSSVKPDGLKVVLFITKCNIFMTHAYVLLLSYVTNFLQPKLQSCFGAETYTGGLFCMHATRGNGHTVPDMSKSDAQFQFLTVM